MIPDALKLFQNVLTLHARPVSIVKNFLDGEERFVRFMLVLLRQQLQSARIVFFFLDRVYLFLSNLYLFFKVSDLFVFVANLFICILKLLSITLVRFALKLVPEFEIGDFHPE